MLQVIEAIEEKPGPKTFLLAYEFARGREPAPDRGTAVGLGPYRNDARGFVPTPEPVFRRFQRRLRNGTAAQDNRVTTANTSQLLSAP